MDLEVQSDAQSGFSQVTTTSPKPPTAATIGRGWGKGKGKVKGKGGTKQKQQLLQGRRGRGGWDKWVMFVSAPITKFTIHVTGYIVFLLLFTYYYLYEVSSPKHSAIHFAQISFLGQNHYTLLHCSLLSLRSVISQTLCHTLRTDILPMSESLHTITLFTLISTKCHLPNTLPYTLHRYPSYVRITTHYYTVHSYLYEVSSPKHSAIHYAQISFIGQNHYTLLHCSLLSLRSVICQTLCHTLRTDILPMSESLHTITLFTLISTKCHLANTLPYTTLKNPS